MTFAETSTFKSSIFKSLSIHLRIEEKYAEIFSPLVGTSPL